MSGLIPFKGTIRSFKRNRSLLTEKHLIALKGRVKSSFIVTGEYIISKLNVSFIFKGAS